MSTTIAERLASLGHRLPEPSGSAGTYVPVARAGALLLVAGQISRQAGGDVDLGRLGVSVSVEEGRRAAENAALGLIAQISQAVDGHFDRVIRVARLGVFVAATDSFRAHSEVANGALDLLVAVFGEAGRHARAAVGVASLPTGAVVEVDAIVELAD